MSPRCFLPCFKSIGLSFQEKKRKIDFQDGGHSSYLGFPIITILAFFNYKSARFFLQCFLPSLKSSGLSIQEKRRQIDFQDSSHGGHLGFLIGTILAMFDLQVTPMLPTKFQVSWLFGSGEAAKNKFSRWRPLRPSWISDRNKFSYIWSTSHPDAPTKFQDNLPFDSGEEAKKLNSKMAAVLEFRLERF